MDLIPIPHGFLIWLTRPHWPMQPHSQPMPKQPGMLQPQWPPSVAEQVRWPRVPIRLRPVGIHQICQIIVESTVRRVLTFRGRTTSVLASEIRIKSTLAQVKKKLTKKTKLENILFWLWSFIRSIYQSQLILKKKYFDYRDNTASMFLFSNFRLVIVMYCNTVNFQLAKKNESKRRKERERKNCYFSSQN